MIGLHQLAGAKRSNRKRIGRGHGSGLGTYAGKGIKGQRARTGGRRGIARRSLKALISRIPKVRGMTVARAHDLVPVSLTAIDQAFERGARVTREALVEKGLLPKRQRVVVVLQGVLTKPLTIEAHRFSANASRGITEAGGSMIHLKAHQRLAPKRRARP